MKSIETVFAVLALMLATAGCHLPSPPRTLRSSIKVESYDPETYLVILDAYYGNRHLGTPRMLVRRDRPDRCLLGKKTDAPADPFLSRDFGPVDTNIEGFDVHVRISPTRDSGIVAADILLQCRKSDGQSDYPEMLQEFHGVRVELNRETDLAAGSAMP